MALEIVRRIRGNVHGSIDISATEDKVISHWVVQRLRRIRQLAFLPYVFPGASHSRFEHSLGVMHLAGVAWQKLPLNQKRLEVAAKKYPDFAAIEKRGVKGMTHGLLEPTFPLLDKIFEDDYILQALRLAALLHDLGHPPFSHSGERFLPSWEQVLKDNDDLPDYLKEYLQKKIDALKAKGDDPGKKPVRHEVFTLLLVDKVLNETYQQFPDIDLKVSARDVIAVIFPEIKPDKTSVLNEHKAYILLHEMVSGEVDCDRMDYLLRDSRECGVVYGIFDASRILDSLGVYFDPKDESLHVAIHLSGLAAFEDYLRARHSMYLQLYFHKTAVACEAMMQHLATMLGGWTLPARRDEYVEIDEYNVGSMLILAARYKLKDEDTRDYFEDTLKDLLYRRTLWKRVFELTGKTSAEIDPKAIAGAKAIIESFGLRYEQVSSSGSMTRFRPRRENEPSQNYLRLIKKDEHQFPRVVPIEDHMSLISGGETVQITRLYVEQHPGKEGEAKISKLKQELIKTL